MTAVFATVTPMTAVFATVTPMTAVFATVTPMTGAPTTPPMATGRIPEALAPVPPAPALARTSPQRTSRARRAPPT
jgi:hypothetical protein